MEAKKATSLYWGFILSVLLILGMYWVAVGSNLTGLSLRLTILGLACAQAFVQLVCFFPLGSESKPHWNWITLLFLILIVIIVVGGSLWIMHNLDYQMM